LWCRLGRSPTSGLNSNFGAFCGGVFEAIGWPTEEGHAESPTAELFRATLSNRRPDHQPQNQQEQKDDDKDEKKHFGDAGRGRRNSSKPEQASDDRYYQEE
jgi:hypothetical protein